ncbi:hypothetical protein V8E52_008467 [Russula decolorans]
MSDPDHVPAQHAAAIEQPTQAEQTQLDEEFARQLLLEDEQHCSSMPATKLRCDSNSNNRCRSGMRCRTCRNCLVNLPKVRFVSVQVASLEALSGIRFAACAGLLRCFSHIVAGERTFSSLISKVKAKVQDFDQQRNTSDKSSSSGTGTGAGTGYVAQPPSLGLDRHPQQE